LLRWNAGASRGTRIDPRCEVLRAQFRKSQQQVAQVALRIDGDGRHAVDGCLLQQRQAQAGLAAAGHADADRMRGEVARVVQQRLRMVHAALGVELTAQVEHAEGFVGRQVGHGRFAHETVSAKNFW
jgi:hypothetical protein